MLVVEGIPGTSRLGLARIAASRRAWPPTPDVKIVGDVAGMWTDQIAQAEVQKWLATHPGKLDGIVVQSAAELGVLRALQQSGRKMVPVAHRRRDSARCATGASTPTISAPPIQLWPPGDDIELIWNIMMRTLEGPGAQDPVGAGRIRSSSPMTTSRGCLGENCDENSDKWLRTSGSTSGAATGLSRRVLPASRRSDEAYKP